MHIVHLTASALFGGPERQMLGLAEHLPAQFETSFLSFSEGGRCLSFLAEARDLGYDAIELENDTPRVRAAITEIADYLEATHASVLITHGYKSNLLGRPAARRVGVPIISVSRGWTGENLKVRCYETLDKAHLRFMDKVVCVSAGQATKVRRTGVPDNKVSIIWNAARLSAFKQPDQDAQTELQEMCGGEGPIILAAGRLSPEKGFQVLVEAAPKILAAEPQARFVLFGDGMLRESIEQRLKALKMEDSFRLVGFRSDLDRYIPWADLVVLPSFTEGLPNVALEASAASVPVVATAVGGTGEVVIDRETGFLVPAGNPEALSRRILDLVRDPHLRREYGLAGRSRMQALFTFEAQARQYVRLFSELEPSQAPILDEAELSWA
jgi:glycosyltransferase involved in cell wall biosynthesis